MRIIITCTLTVLLLAACSGKPPEPKDVCADFACGTGGRCAVLDGAPACLCSAGFEARDGRCEAVASVDWCASTPCSGLVNSVCITDGTQTRCECPSTLVEVAGECVVRTPCRPNPCTGARQTTCDDSTGVAQCLCDEELVLVGTACVRPTHWDCARAHAGDSAEPDECPRLAFELPREVFVNRTLAPVGDHDWFRMQVTPGYVFRFSASGTVPLRIDVFDEAGTRIAGDGRGAVSFRAPTAVTTLYARVIAQNPADEDTYTARFQDLGLDDFANEAALATQLSGNFAGTIQYEGDVDVAQLVLPASTATVLSSDGGGIATFTLGFSDGGTRSIDGQKLSFTPPTDELVTLTARARSFRSEGAFNLDIVTHGRDDHSDDVRFGTSLPLATDVTGAIQFAGDVDTFVFTPVVHHIYRPTLVGNGESLSVIANSASVVSAGADWKATDTSLVQLRVRGVTGQPPYVLRVDDLGLDAHGDSLGTSTSLALETPISGLLEHGNDVDYFRIDVRPGRVMNAIVTSPSSTVTVSLYDRVGVGFGSSTSALAFCMPAFDTYYLAVRNTQNQPSTYSLVVRDRGPDDFGDANSPTTLFAETPVTGALQYPSDVDAFQLTLTAQRLYRATCVSNASCQLTVSGPGVSQRGTGSVNFIAPSTGTYLVELALPTGTPPPVAWSLKVTDIGSDDHGDSLATATPLNVDTVATGTLEWQQDVDVFVVPVIANRLYEVDVTGADIDVIRPDDSVIPVLMPHYSFRATATENVRIEVQTREGQLSGAYTLMMRDVGLDDHGDTPLTATMVTLPSNAVANIQFVGDVDVFSFPVTPNRYYLSANSECVQSLPVFSERTTDDVIFQAPANETRLWLRLSGMPSRPCVVNVREFIFDDHSNSEVGATPLTFDAGVDGVFEMGRDIDTFTFELTVPSTPVGVHLHENGLPIFNALSVISPSGQIVSGSGGIGFEVTESGRYFAMVFGRRAGQQYTVALTTEPDDFGNTVATAAPISVGVTQHGARQYTADVDVFTITLQGGVSYVATTAYEADAKVRFYTASGQLIGGVDTITPVTTGTYEVRVSGANTSAWTPYDYALNIDVDPN